MIVAFGNIATSLFAGFVIFAIIGYLANELNMKVEDVVDQGMYVKSYLTRKAPKKQISKNF